MTVWNAPRVPSRITPAFGFPYISERALRESLGRRQFGQAEMQQVIQCSLAMKRDLCNNPPVPFAEAKTYGETVLGNMVLACQQCDDSKGKASFQL